MGEGADLSLRSDRSSLAKLLSFATQWRRLMPLGLGLVGLALMVVGFLAGDIELHQSTSTPNKKLVSTEENVAGTVSGKQKMILVDIEGAVEKPGVYEIPVDSRIKDVLISAGGISAKGNRTYISKNINMAQRLIDGMKIYIPFAEENVVGLQATGAVGGVANTSLININTASLDQLDSLPGIGAVTAQKIIDGRPYGLVEDLIKRRVVSASVFQRIKDRIAIQ